MHHKLNNFQFLKQLLAEPMPERDGCLEWPRARVSRGYGSITTGGKFHGAHRLAMELTLGGKIPEGMDVCHVCDNPPCIRPSHLFLGTKSDNMKDRNAKGRNFSNIGVQAGEKHHGAKLTQEQVLEIRELSAAGLIQRVIAQRFGVRRSTIGAIVNRKRWRHI